MKSECPDTLCPITRSTSVIGDRWSIMILRELFMGLSRFQDIQDQTGATPQMLTARFKRLEADGLIERRAYSKRPLRYEYRLTPMGRETRSIILALRSWGEAWVKRPREGVAVRMTHRTCGTETHFDGTCPACRIVAPWQDLVGQPTPAYTAERSKRADAFTQSLRT